ncbi:MAG: hypothetical protein ACRC8T_07880 [Acidaminococcaceae bacterium]
MLRKLSFDDGLVRANWQDLYCRNESLLPYASREYNELFKKYFRLNAKRLFLRNYIYGLYDENETLLMIIPLCIKGRELYIFGDFGNEEILDFIYPDTVKAEHFDLLMAELRKKFNGYKLILNRLAPDSFFRVWLESRNYRSLATRSYAHLCLVSSYEEYFRKLPAETAENIRNAEKFMEKIGVGYRLQFIRGPLSDKVKKQGFAILNQKVSGRLDELRFMPHRYSSKNFNALTDICTKESNSFNAFLYIGDEMAAFASGFFDLHEKRLFIRKVGIDNNYDKDLLWVFLQTQGIKWLIQNSAFEWVDFGNLKKQYRNWLGCEDYYCQSYEIEL